MFVLKLSVPVDVNEPCNKKKNRQTEDFLFEMEGREALQVNSFDVAFCRMSCLNYEYKNKVV